MLLVGIGAFIGAAIGFVVGIVEFARAAMWDGYLSDLTGRETL
jgi:hypothetical protein